MTEQRERRRLAEVLHDHIQQLLVAAKYRLSGLAHSSDSMQREATQKIEELIDESIAASRSLTAELSPPILHDGGLNAGLEWLARRMADRQGLHVDLDLEEIGFVRDDLKILLFECVRELLFNVAKHARTSVAAVSLRRIDDFARLTVSDQGTGFDPGHFARAAGTDKGFGLFSVRERLELFGGKMEIDSAPGKGSRVFLSLPLAPQASDVADAAIRVTQSLSSAASVSAPPSGKKIRVLLADDHAVVRQGIGNMLGNEPDIEIIGSAGDGQEAVDLSDKLLPDVILMDTSMPKLNGIEATRIIHNNHPEICIIGLSMFEEVERSQAMREAGAADYVTKSGAAEKLMSAIRAAIKASPKEAAAGTNL